VYVVIVVQTKWFLVCRRTCIGEPSFILRIYFSFIKLNNLWTVLPKNSQQVTGNVKTIYSANGAQHPMTQEDGHGWQRIWKANNDLLLVLSHYGGGAHGSAVG